MLWDVELDPPVYKPVLLVNAPGARIIMGKEVGEMLCMAMGTAISYWRDDERNGYCYRHMSDQKTVFISNAEIMRVRPLTPDFVADLIMRKFAAP